MVCHSISALGKCLVRTWSTFLMHAMPWAPCPCPNDLGLFFLRNWLPITLINVDYKFASQVLADRPLKALHVEVNTDQAFWAPGRFFGENVAFLRDIINSTTFCNFPAAALSLDQKKTFDRVDWWLCFVSKMASVHPFFNESVSFLQVFRIVLMPTVICPPFFVLSRGVR